MAHPREGFARLLSSGVYFRSEIFKANAVALLFSIGHAVEISPAEK